MGQDDDDQQRFVPEYCDEDGSTPYTHRGAHKAVAHPSLSLSLSLFLPDIVNRLLTPNLRQSVHL